MRGRSYDSGVCVTRSRGRKGSLVTKNYCMQHCYLGKGTEVNEKHLAYANLNIFKDAFL